MTRLPKWRTDEAKEVLREQLAEVYTPGAPITDSALFSGRREIVADIEEQMAIIGMHIVLYGERAVGKTSLWSVILSEKKVSHHSASSTDDFVSIFLRVLEKLGEQFGENERTRLETGSIAVGAGGTHADVSESTGASEVVLAQRKVDLNLVLDRIALHSGDLDAIVIDEFQNLPKTTVQSQIIEVVKGFSDRKLKIHMFIVGVADSSDALLSSPEYEQYEDRHFTPYRVPVMTDAEVGEIMDLRKQDFGVDLESDVRDAIVRIASGYPGIAHRLALSATERWVSRAFVGYVVNIGVALASYLVPLVGLVGQLSVKKAGIKVEARDLRAAVQRYVSRWDESLPTSPVPYEELVVLISKSETPYLSASAGEEALGLSAEELDQLVADSSGLVTRDVLGLKLQRPDVRCYFEAKRYLARAA